MLLSRLTLRYTAFAALAASFSALPGCDCSGGEVSIPGKLELVFEYPTQGTVVTSQDDANATAPGIQVSVVARVRGLKSGATLLLMNDQDVDATGAPVQASAKVADGRVTFSGYTLPEGDVRLRLELEDSPPGLDCAVDEECEEVSIQVVESICFFDGPLPGDTLTTDAYPDAANPFDPFETDVAVSCRGVAAGDNVALIVNGGRARVAPVDANRRVVFAEVALAEGPNTLQVLPRTDADGNDPQGAATSATVTVNTGRCTAALLPGDGSRLLAADDLDANASNGMQANIDLISSCAQSATVTLFVRGPGAAAYSQVTPTSITPLVDAAGVRFRLAGVQLPQSVNPYDVEVVARIDESGGRSGLAVPVAYWVDSSKPSLVSYSPGAGVCLGPIQDADGNAANGIQVDVFGTLVGAENGSEVWVRGFLTGSTVASCASDTECSGGQVCRAQACRTVATVTSASFVARAVPVPAGAVTLEYIGLDLAGNQSQAVNVAVSVIAVAPGVSISAPANNAVLGVAQDLDIGAPDLQYSVQLALTDVTSGSSGSLIISGQPSVAFTPASGTVSVPVVLEDGSRTLRARLQDTCGNLVETPPVTVTVQSSAPVIGVSAVESGSSPAVSVEDADYTRANSLDLDIVVGAGAGSSSRSLTVSRFAGVDTSGAARACTGASVSVASVTLAASDVGALVSAAALVEGVNCFVVAVDDGVNPVSTTFLVQRRTTAPGVTLTSPAAAAALTASDDSDANASNGFNYDVLVELDAPNDLDGTVTVELSTVALGGVFASFSQPVAAGGAVAVFSDAGLPAGSYTVTATYRDRLGNIGVSDSASISVTLGAGPQVAISIPSTGAYVAPVGGNIDVTVVHVGAATSVSCAASVDGGAAQASVSWATPSSPLVIPVAVTDGLRSIRVQCVDGAAATGDTQAVLVNVDATAPAAPTFVNEAAGTPGRLVFDVAPSYVNVDTADTSAAAGLQHGVGVSVTTGGESPAGWVVELTVTPPGGSPTSYTRTLAGGGDPVVVTFSNVDFGAAEGAISFSATVADAAGNVSTAATATLTIDLTPPTLTQTSPSPSKATLVRDDDQNVDLTYVDTRFTYTTTGVAAGATVALEIEPPPAGKTAADFPVAIPIVSGTAQSSLYAFADGTYVATATLLDAAGNASEVVYQFDVAGAALQLTRAGTKKAVLSTADDDIAGGEFQETFSYNATGFVGGTPVWLCSTVASPGGGTTPCRWGRDANGLPTLGGADAGVVVGAGFLSGSTSIATVTFSAVTLGQGAQVLHAEAREVSGTREIASEFDALMVDSVRPVVATAVLLDNQTGNDGPSVLRLNGSERTVVSGKLRTGFRAAVTGLEDGQPVSVRSSVPAAGTVVGSGTYSASLGYAQFDIDLSQGAQTLSFVATDAAGNTNLASGDTVPSLSVLVDFTAGSATVPTPSFSPYTSAHGTVSSNQLTLGSGAGIVVTFSDGQPVEGGKIRLERMTAASGGTVVGGSAVEQSVGASQTSATFSGYVLAMGLNHLRAVFTDPAGNEATSAVVTYGADFMGPALSLSLRNAAGASVGSCDTYAAKCTVDTLTPGGDSRVVLDTTAASAYCPPAAGTSCSAAGSALFVQLTGCVNSDASLESCPISVLLESRIVDDTNQGGPGDTRPFEAVNASPRGMSDIDPAALQFADARFDPGFHREVRMRAVDANGNVSVSSSVFVSTWLEGVVIEVERLDGSLALTGDLLEDDDYFGIAENTSGVAGTFATNFEVRVAVVGAQTPTEVVMTVNGGTPTSQPLVGGKATFGGVAFNKMVDPATPVTNSVILTAKCGSSDCGTKQYTGIVADIDAPTYQFDRCSLCALGVPLVDNGLCSTCGTVDANANANMALPGTAVAIWNAAGDQDANPANGFNIASTPLVVKLVGVESGQTVTLSSDQGALSGSGVLSAGCPGATCKATYNALGVPSLSGTTAHRLSVSFTDHAGNAAVPVAVRGDATRESVYARTDTIAPAGVSPTVCIGESTTPAGVSPASSDPTTFEDSAVCPAACTATGDCNRRAGSATLVWTAPGDDGAGGGRVASYQIGVAPLQIPTPPPAGTVYTGCSELTTTSTYEQLLSVGATVDPGAAEAPFGLSDLYPHRSYCFAVIAVDDVGNKAVVGTFAKERKLPLIHAPGTAIGVFDPANQADDAAGRALYTDIAGTAVKFGYNLANVGDMDGDGKDDFAVARFRTSTSEPVSQVAVFLTASSLTAPTVTIVAPGVDQANLGALDSGFGGAIAGGDFDGDGLSDLAICAGALTSLSGGNHGEYSGALYLWYGVAATGMRKDANSTDNELPSVNPDVSLIGQAYDDFCNSLAMGDIDAAQKVPGPGAKGDDLLVGNYAGFMPFVYGFYSDGTRTRFGSPSGSPAKVKTVLDLVSTPNGAANRANFSVTARDVVGPTDGPGGGVSGSYPFFPGAIALADLNGDGALDVVASDRGAYFNSGACGDPGNECGEVYVYAGGGGAVPSLSGAVPSPSSSPTQLMKILRHDSSRRQFGASLTRLVKPRGPTDATDWLLVQAKHGDAMTVFRGSALAASYPVALASYEELDKSDWNGSIIEGVGGSTPVDWGSTSAFLGDFDGYGGADIVVGTGGVTSLSRPAIVYSYSESMGRFAKRAVLRGGANFMGVVRGLGNYSASGRSDIVFTNPTASSVFVLR